MKLNDDEIAGLTVPATGKKLYSFAGAKVNGKETPRGFNVKVQANGLKTFVVRYVFGNADKLYTIGRVNEWTVARAVERARTVRQMIDKGEDPLAVRVKEQSRAAGIDSVEAVCEQWLVREGGMKRGDNDEPTFSGKMRSAPERLRAFERLVYPEIGARPIDEVSRLELVRLFDKIADENGPRMSDLTLAYVRKVFNWHATRSDHFRSPIVKGMTREKPKEHEGDRILTDDELRAVWKATDSDDPLHRYIRFVLLTACRRSEAGEMPWNEIDDEGWMLPKTRHKIKTQDFFRPLSPQARAMLGERKGVYPFSTDGRNPMSGYTQMLRRIHKESKTSGWSLHDLRRTARTLLSRAGVPNDIAERCLGHAMGGVRSVYDRWEYRREKAEAFAALVAQIERIIAFQRTVQVISLAERRV